MDKKDILRKKFSIKRKNNYFEINKEFFIPLRKLIKKIFKSKKINLSLYYPNSFELNVLLITEIEYFKKFKFLLPVIGKKKTMNFYLWKNKDILNVNKYGILEPSKSSLLKPDIILLPMLAFDKKKNRLGYGGGFYDKYLNKYLKKNKKILTVGVAFSFQKYHNLPTNVKDYKLDFILTEKGMIK